jgi:hypothetical protein
MPKRSLASSPTCVAADQVCACDLVSSNANTNPCSCWYSPTPYSPSGDACLILDMRPWNRRSSDVGVLIDIIEDWLLLHLRLELSSFPRSPP